MREGLKPCPFCGEKIINIPYTRAYAGGLCQGVIQCSCGVEMRIKVVAPPKNESSRALHALLNPNTAVFDGDPKDVDAIIDFARRTMSERWNRRAIDIDALREVVDELECDYRPKDYASVDALCELSNDASKALAKRIREAVGL